jgi:hypothetical protein
LKISSTARRISTTLDSEAVTRSINATEHAMARNFGVPRHFQDQTHSPVWPLWIVAVVAVAIINVATFLPH